MSITLTTPVTYTDPMTKAQVSCASVSLIAMTLDLSSQTLTATFQAGNVVSSVFVPASGFTPVTAKVRLLSGALTINNAPQTPLTSAQLASLQSLLATCKQGVETAAQAVSGIAGTVTTP